MHSILTRHDEGGSFDSIKWAFETHVKRDDNHAFNFAVLYGGEDAPSSIDFWESDSPEVSDPPAYRWHGEKHEVIVYFETLDPRKLDDFLRIVLGLTGLFDAAKSSLTFEVKRSEILDREDEEPF